MRSIAPQSCLLKNVLCFCMATLALCYTKPLHPGFYDENGNRGFYFFEDPKNQGKPEKETPKTPEEAAERMAEQREELYQLRCLAILSPSEENVTNYIQEQNKILSQSEGFAKTWQYLLLDHPDLGEGSTNPTAAAGIEVRKKTEDASKKLTLDALSEKYFLVLFANGGDLYSEQAGKVASQFAKIAGWHLRVVSLNGAPLQDLPSVETDKGLAQKYGIQSAPSFLMINPETKEGVPVGVGALSVVDLIDNIYKQAKRHLLEEKS